MSQAEDKQHNQQHWDLMAPRWKAWWYRYGPASQPVSDYLVQQARLTPGDRVLDLATGLGEPALSFARAVGPDGLVLGLDQAAQMVAFARERAAEAGLRQLRFEVQDIEALQLPEQPPFDAIVSRWGLMFMTDLVGTLQRLRPWLAAEGRLVAAVWSRPETVPMLTLPADVLKQTLDIDLSRPGPGPFDLAAPGRLEAVLATAGFTVRECETVDVVLDYADEETFLKERQLTSPLLESALAGLTPAARGRYDQALAEALNPWRQSEGIRLVNRTLCVTATR